MSVIFVPPPFAADAILDSHRVAGQVRLGIAQEGQRRLVVQVFKAQEAEDCIVGAPPLKALLIHLGDEADLLCLPDVVLDLLDGLGVLLEAFHLVLVEGINSKGLGDITVINVTQDGDLVSMKKVVMVGLTLRLG